MNCETIIQNDTPSSITWDEAMQINLDRCERFARNKKILIKLGMWRDRLSMISADELDAYVEEAREQYETTRKVTTK